MATVYLRKFYLPSRGAEEDFFTTESRTCFYTAYPFHVFPFDMLRSIPLGEITIFYGGNGSGKSTLLNLMASKLSAVRFSDFNSAPYFEQYVGMCHAELARRPLACYVLTSDDVFDYSLNARSVNGHIEDRRNELFARYRDMHAQAVRDPEVGRLHGLGDFERWREARDILSPRRSQSAYIRNNTARDVDLLSNGQTAMRYFIDRIDEDALYFLDEPENSLSVERQMELAEYLEATARATRSQFVIATHSPILLSMAGAQIYNLDARPVGTCRWTELPNVRRYYDFFMAHREEFEENKD